MVGKEISDITTRRALTKKLNPVIEYVKLYYAGHVGDCTDVMHDTMGALHGRCS